MRAAVVIAARSISLLVAGALGCAAGCGETVVDQREERSDTAPSSASGAPDGGSPERDASACDDPSVCSRVIDRGGCIGATRVGDVCDFLATPCDGVPPDCSRLDGIAGVGATLASCGDGRSFCSVPWSGTVTDAILEALCSAHRAAGRPLDCGLD